MVLDFLAAATPTTTNVSSVAMGGVGAILLREALAMIPRYWERNSKTAQDSAIDKNTVIVADLVQKLTAQDVTLKHIMGDLESIENRPQDSNVNDMWRNLYTQLLDLSNANAEKTQKQLIESVRRGEALTKETKKLLKEAMLTIDRNNQYFDEEDLC